MTWQLPINLSDVRKSPLVWTHLLRSVKFKIITLLMNSKSINQYLRVEVKFHHIYIPPIFKKRRWYRTCTPGGRMLGNILEICLPQPYNRKIILTSCGKQFEPILCQPLYAIGIYHLRTFNPASNSFCHFLGIRWCQVFVCNDSTIWSP